MNISINTYRRKIGNHGVIHPSYDQAIVQYIDHGLYRLKRHKVVCACIIQQKGKRKTRMHRSTLVTLKLLASVSFKMPSSKSKKLDE